VSKLGKREALVKRKTRETDIEVYLSLDGERDIQMEMDVPFFPHLLESMAFYAHWDLKIKAITSEFIDDYHHIVEDTGIVLGEALEKCLGDKKGIERFATVFIPMDEALSMVAIDLSGRPYLLWEKPDLGEKVGSFEVGLVKEFLQALVNNAKITLHAKIWWGENGHHCLEALFKALGKSLAQAANITSVYLPSTKGTL